MGISTLHKFMMEYLDQNLDRNLRPYHSSRHTDMVWRDVRSFALNCPELGTDELRLLEAAALCHDVGYVERPNDHEQGSVAFVVKHLSEFGFSPEETERVGSLILATKMPCVPKNKLEALLCDADIGYLGSSDFEEISGLFRKELQANGRIFSDMEWIRFELDFFRNYGFRTEAANHLLSGGRLKNLESLQAQLVQLTETIESLSGREIYSVVEKIAEGGMGMVFKARKIGVAGFEKTVAIKMMLKQICQDDQSRNNFINEAKLVANLIHENIVQIYQLEEAPQGYYFVLEFVDGISLHDFMAMHHKLGEKLPLMLAVFVVSRVARGLAYAHNRRADDGRMLGIVHCDICPRNILINSEGVPKITDFGIARVGTHSSSSHVSGKLAFMAPEQAGGGEVDFRADLYSLGIVLFQLLSDKPARDVTTSATEQLKNIRKNRLLWENLAPDLPEDLVRILHKMLASQPKDRYENTAELARELEYFIYKDGYGPTVVTLADYMRKLLPGRFITYTSSPVDDLEKTVPLQ